MRRLTLVAFLFVSSSLWAMHYDRQGAVAYANKWQDFKKYGFDGYMSWFSSGGDCCKFACRALSDSSGGKLHFWGVKDTVMKVDTCRKFPSGEPDTLRLLHLGKLDNEGQFYSIGQLMFCLREWGVARTNYALGQPIPDSLDKGDLIFLTDPQTGANRHVMIIDSINRQNGSIYFDEHWGPNINGDTGFRCNTNITAYLGQKHPLTCRLAHIPDTIMRCMDLKQYESNDSTVGHRPDRYHGTHCCWHENIGGTWPWTSDPTPYACLSWSEPGRTTKDSLILPRINLAACSSAIAVWACTTNLYSWGTRVAQVLGSTDDGATWDTLGDNTLDSVDMPWATNQRKVRLAFVYTGPIMNDTFWCIDHFRVIARPTRDTDISISQIKVPGGHGKDTLPLTIPGQTIVPEAYVWNCGKHDESVLFTFKIDGGSTYFDTVRLNLFPYLDTCVRFASWTVTTGSHTAVCYASLPGDECSANDTVTQNFLAVGDTWAQLSKIYGDVGFKAGAALATVDAGNIYCAPGSGTAGKKAKYYFSKYIVYQNLFYGRCPTPSKFLTGLG
jgi:hypothetical protein